MSELPKDLNIFSKEVSFPKAFISDSHKCHKSKDVRTFCHKIGTTVRILEGGTQWENIAKLYVGLFKESVRKYMCDENLPMVFWDYCAKQSALMTIMVANDIFQLRGNTPHFSTFGEECDISKIYQFGWYEWVYFCEVSDAFPMPSHVLGRCLRPAKNEGNEMAKWVLKFNGDIFHGKQCVNSLLTS